MDNYINVMIRQHFSSKRGFLVKGLFLIALAFSSSKRALASPIRDNSPILGFADQVRLRHLYADNEHTHLHLQITPEGKVSGTKEKNLYSLLEIKAVKPSILVIKGVKTTRYLCMDSRHHLYGSLFYKEDDCNFREVPQADGYNLYYSEKHPAQLTLTPSRGGHQFGKQLVRFMPLESSIPLESLYAIDNSYDYQPGSNLHIEDPLGMIDRSSIFSPSLDS
ncbi:fibroblast growth factor 21 [Bufo gargarizans]|uniref:fibroblast growth factor 21 n=1 Tax=Bufo gargarizans TaxID=30331 RepID=UPI001CF5FD49|nr:fibroblast growth factor 21 [Bufo gargarizans]